MSGEEIFDVVDEQDRVVAQAPRSEVHARGLLHRAVHIFVRTSGGELLIHRRSATKDEYPLRITSSAAGHVGAGETYEAAAVRELQEELGLCAPLELAARFAAGPETSNEHSWLFLATTDEAPVFDAGEIASGWYCAPAELAEGVRARPDDYTPAFRTLFEWYWQNLPNRGE